MLYAGVIPLKLLQNVENWKSNHLLTTEDIFETFYFDLIEHLSQFDIKYILFEFQSMNE